MKTCTNNVQLLKWKVFVSTVNFDKPVLNFQTIIRTFLCHFFSSSNLCIFSIFTNEFYSLLRRENVGGDVFFLWKEITLWKCQCQTFIMKSSL